MEIEFASNSGRKNLIFATNFVDLLSCADTQAIERSWKTEKERNKRHSGTHRNMMDFYMCEFMWMKKY